MKENTIVSLADSNYFELLNELVDSIQKFESSKILSSENINIRVISFPSWEIFDKKSKKEKMEILGNKLLFAIEAGAVNGWEKYVSNENFIGMKSFGASGPYKELFEHFGITSKALVKLIKERIE